MGAPPVMTQLEAESTLASAARTLAWRQRGPLPGGLGEPRDPRWHLIPFGSGRLLGSQGHQDQRTWRVMGAALRHGAGEGAAERSPRVIAQHE